MCVSDRIVATGPKNPEFLRLAARAGVTVSVDSVSELDQPPGSSASTPSPGPRPPAFVRGPGIRREC
jgi:hypothetical protein